MSHSNFIVRRVAVLGAGVMGAQIAAHLVNADIETLLFDLPGKDEPNGIVKRAVTQLQKLEPAPLVTRDRADYIQAANYDHDLPLLAGCDLVIEAIAERLDWKPDLYAKIAPHLNPAGILASNTSGLSINRRAECLPAAQRERFCGVHFFNPPRYMHLVELIPAQATDPFVLEDLEAFLVTNLGKGVVRAKDTPNFIANRVGVFAMLAAMIHTERLGLGFDEVDALTGPAIGRPRSATYRTADVVGLDTFGHVIQTMTNNLPEDPWHRFYRAPAWLSSLVSKGALGQKAGAGVYRKRGREIEVLDLARADYRPSGGTIADEVQKILGINFIGDRLAALRASTHPQAQFLWSIQRDLLHYSAVHLEAIADTARDVDLAVRWGFGWDRGPFETWQMAGWSDIARAIQEDIEAGKSLTEAPLPRFAADASRAAVHTRAGSYSPAAGAFKPRSELAVYQRQPLGDKVAGEAQLLGSKMFENDGLRLWQFDDDIAVVSFKSKMNAVGAAVLEGLQRSVEEAEKSCKGLVLFQTDGPFSVGANLLELAPLLQQKKFAELDAAVANFQTTSQRLKYAKVPVVAAVRGMALGGGCELAMHSARCVAATESYFGLVEAGVGLIPAGGGCKEFALRAANAGGDLLWFLRPAFESIAKAQTSRSAQEARQLGFLRAQDSIVFNQHEVLHVAKAQVEALYQSAYRPALPPRAIAVAGATGIATLQAALVNLREGGMISAHDFVVARALAYAMCGGEIDAGSLVDEAWLLKCERDMFVALLQTEATQARISHMLKTGKPLRN